MGSAPSSPRRARGWNRPTDDGAEKQSDADIESEFTRITIDDIPEEYRNVHISQDVMRQINQRTDVAADPALSSQLIKQLQENDELRNRIKQLQLQSVPHQMSPGQTSENVAFTEEELRTRKKIFDETVSNLEKQFFTPHRINACIEEENAILGCLEKNPNKVLNCRPLSIPYKSCIEQFRAKVLQESLSTYS